METQLNNNEQVKDITQYPYVGSWYSSTEISYKENSQSHHKLRVCGMITGCGIMQIHGFLNMFSLGYEYDLKFIHTELKKLRRNGCGVFLATLGQKHYIYEKQLLELGFEKLSEYPNYRHGQPYKQKLFILKLLDEQS